MTNKEAVEIIKECKEKGFKHTFYTLNEYHTALDMAIKALGALQKIIDLDTYDQSMDAWTGIEYVKRIVEEMLGEVGETDGYNNPMQVELEGDGYADGELVYDYGKCPKCGWEFEEGDKDWEEPYCCHCGQRLDWCEEVGKTDE